MGDPKRPPTRRVGASVPPTTPSPITSAMGLFVGVDEVELGQGWCCLHLTHGSRFSKITSTLNCS